MHLKGQEKLYLRGPYQLAKINLFLASAKLVQKEKIDKVLSLNKGKQGLHYPAI